MKRTRPGVATGGSMARMVMIAGTALIQVIRSCLDQLPEAPAAELAVEHQAGSRREGAEQPDHLGVDVEQGQAAVAPVGRGQPVVAATEPATCTADPHGAGCPWACRWSRSCTGRSRPARPAPRACTGAAAAARQAAEHGEAH